MMTRLKLLFYAPAALLVFSAGYLAGTHETTVKADSSRVFELRTYHCAPGKLDDLLKRFREHTMTIFERHGMHNVAYFTPTDEPQKSNTLIYIISHASREQADENWKAFNSDPEWQKVKAASEANGKIVEKVDRVFMSPTEFSPLK
ncbi:MAG: NIPSNAP family protein [Bryobacteraceae bacterium]